MPDMVEAVPEIVLGDNLELLTKQIKGGPNPSPVISIPPIHGPASSSPRSYPRVKPAASRPVAVAEQR